MDVFLMILMLIALILTTLGAKAYPTLKKLSQITKPIKVVREDGTEETVSLEELTRIMVKTLEEEGLLKKESKSVNTEEVSGKENGLEHVVKLVLETPNMKLPPLKKDGEKELLEALRRVDEEKYLIIYYRRKGYGVRKIAKELRKHGYKTGKTRVWEIIKTLKEKGFPIY